MKTFLILHGWGSCAKNWDKVRELLENQGYKVFVSDLPGFGQNPVPDQPWSIDDYVDWVEKYINDLLTSGELKEPFYLLGHSFGGALATKFAIRQPKKIKKLFLVGCAGIRRKTIKKRIIKKIAKFFNFFSFLPFYPLIRKFLYRFILRSDYLGVKNSIMKKTYQNMISKDISSQFSKISIPTILIWGKKDKLTPLKDAYYMKNMIPKVKLELLSNIFHCPHSENPKLLVDKILTYT